jgi:hypothetical protein
MTGRPCGAHSARRREQGVFQNPQRTTVRAVYTHRPRAVERELAWSQVLRTARGDRHDNTDAI